MIPDQAWEAMLDAAAEIPPEWRSADDRRCGAMAALDAVRVRFECFPASDLPARAVVALVDALIDVIRAEFRDEDEIEEAA